MKSFVLSVMSIGLMYGCSDSKVESAMASADSVAVVSVEEVAPVEDAAVMATENEAVKDSEPATNVEQKIIREANLRFEVDDLNATYNRIKLSTGKFKGIIQSDEEGKGYDNLYHNLRIRIPSAHFDAFIAEVGTGVGYFDRKEISARDVTEEYIDTEARLNAKKALEARYLELLKKANKVSEMLEIETQLAAVREEIEAKEGALRYMKHRISLSTVVIEFYKTTAVERGATVSFGTKMWNAIKSGFYGISTFFIGLLYLWPFIIILVILFFVIRRRFRKKNK